MFNVFHWKLEHKNKIYLVFSHYHYGPTNPWIFLLSTRSPHWALPLFAWYVFS
jgi:hypothetical protein